MIFQRRLTFQRRHFAKGRGGGVYLYAGRGRRTSNRITASFVIMDIRGFNRGSGRSSKSVSNGIYTCPCGYTYTANSSDEDSVRKRIDLATRLHSKKCHRAKFFKEQRDAESCHKGLSTIYEETTIELNTEKKATNTKLFAECDPECLDTIRRIGVKSRGSGSLSDFVAPKKTRFIDTPVEVDIHPGKQSKLLADAEVNQVVRGVADVKRCDICDKRFKKEKKIAIQSNILIVVCEECANKSDE